MRERCCLRARARFQIVRRNRFRRVPANVDGNCPRFASERKPAQLRFARRRLRGNARVGTRNCLCCFLPNRSRGIFFKNRFRRRFAPFRSRGLCR